MRISDWSSDVCSSDLTVRAGAADAGQAGFPWITLRAATTAVVGIAVKMDRTPIAVGDPLPAGIVPDGAAGTVELGGKIGRASGRERVGASVEISGVAVLIKKKTSSSYEHSTK